MTSFESLKLLCVAFAAHRYTQMGDVAVGDFTRVQFFYQRGDTRIKRYGIYGRGTRVYCIHSEF